MHRPERKAELLCFLTLSEILAFRLTGVWLRIDHLVESARMWLGRHDSRANWRVRIELIQMATDLAHRLVDADESARHRQDIASFFTNDMEVNFASPQAIVVYAQCVEAVMQSR